MKKALLAGAAALALGMTPLISGTASADPDHEKPGKNHHKEMRKLAGELCVAAMSNGAYATLTPDELSDFCTHTAIHIVNADYTADP